VTAARSETAASAAALENSNQSALDMNALKNALAIFLMALLVRLWFNFGTDHVNAFSNADASEYLRYATALSKLNWLHPVYGPEWKEFVISGPVFPFALWLFNFFSLQPYSAANFITPLIFQSIVSAAIASFSYLTALRLFGKNPATFTAIASIIYPAFIVNSGRLYSEVFATFLLSVALWLYAIAQRQPVNQKPKQARPWIIYLALGVTVTLLQLTRSAMLLFTVFTAGFVLLAPLFEGNNIALDSDSGSTKSQRLKRGAKHFAAFLLGFALVTVPWLVFEKSAFNRTNLVVDRTGNYNLFIGTSTKIQGFLSYPYPDGAGIQSKSFSTLIKEAYKERPSAFIKLMMDKPARLFKFPWNDYRTPIGPIGFNLQVLLHEFLILMAVVGLCLGFATSNGYLASNLLAGRLYLLFAFLLNLPYLAFITVPRYNLMAMPVLIIFAAVGFCTLLKLVEQNPRATTKADLKTKTESDQVVLSQTEEKGSKPSPKTEENEEPELSIRERLDSMLPQIAAMSTVFLFVYLRDDLRPDAIFAGSTPLSIYLVQASSVSRGIIAGTAGVLLFTSLYLCISRLTSARAGRLARALNVICALAILPLLFLPQRSNGRFGEAIINLSAQASGKNQMLKGSIPIDAEPVHDSDQFYLIVDSDKAQILDKYIKVIAGDTELKTAPIPGLAALDDWNYLKVRADGTAYLDGTYIFDCMTQTGDITNLDIRQWYLLPLPPQIVQKSKQNKSLDLSISVEDPGQNQSQQIAMFGRSGGKHGPALALYSWEKAFYGVENDHGLTDSRMDEHYSRVQPTNWQAVVDGRSEKLDGIDLNIHLLKVPGTARVEPDPQKVEQPDKQPIEQAEISATGKTAVSLSVTKNMLKANMQLAELHIDYPEGYDKHAHFVSGLSTTKPQFSLSWLDDKGLKCSMTLPWTKVPQDHFAIAIPLKMQNIKGHDIKLNCSYIDDHCTITIKLKDLPEHPLFAPHKIY
jgi:hypothetical protein